MSISKIFIPNFVSVPTNERYKTYETGFLFCRLGHAPGGGTLGQLGYPGDQTFLFKHGHIAYQIEGDDEQNKMQVTFYPRVKLVTLGRGQKVKYH